MPHTHTKPATHKRYSLPLMTSVRGTHGHEGYCSCGWTGLTWKTPSEANAEARWHFWTEHGDMSATRGTEAS